MTMLIGALAEATGTTTRALRHYEKHGLLVSKRASNGYRVFPETSILRVRNIRELLRIGFTVEDVRSFLSYLDRDLPAQFADSGGCTTAIRVAEERLARIRRSIDTLTQLHDGLSARLSSS